MDQYSREFIAEKARLRPEDLGLVRTARRSHNQLGLAYQIAFIRLTGRAPGQQPFEILEDLVGYVSCEAKGLAYKFARSTYPLHSSSPGRDIGRGVSTPPGRQTSIGRVRAAMFDRKSLGEIDRIAGILPSNDPRHPCGFVTRHVGVHH